MVTKCYFIVILLALQAVDACGYSELKRLGKADRPKPGLFRVRGVHNRLLPTAPVSTHPYRMIFQYDTLNQYTTTNPSMATYGEMSKRIYGRMGNYLNTYFQVTYYDTISTGPFTCGGYSYSGYTVNADYLVLVLPQYDPNVSYFAAASGCIDDLATGRPVIGSYYLNFAYMYTNARSEHIYFHVVLHEATHLLGFSSYYYTKYRKPNNGGTYSQSEAMTTSNISGQTFSFLKYPNLLNFAKSYYNDNTIIGVPLEDEGGAGSAGSHWEKTFFPTEYMNPTTENYPVISDFTIELLRATGWYTIATNGAQVYNWGRGQGNAFFTFCPTTSGYCPTNMIGKFYCSDTYKTKASCFKWSEFTNNCPLKVETTSVCEIQIDKDPIPKMDVETYGPQSRCIEYQQKSSGDITPACQNVACNQNNQITITQADGTLFTCSSAGQVINYNSDFQIMCPDPVDFCIKLGQKCPDDCYVNGKGICMRNNECFCFHGKATNGTCSPDNGYLEIPSSDNVNQTGNTGSGAGGSSGGINGQSGTGPSGLAGAINITNNSNNSNTSNETNTSKYAAISSAVWTLVALLLLIMF